MGIMETDHFKHKLYRANDTGKGMLPKQPYIPLKRKIWSNEIEGNG